MPKYKYSIELDCPPFTPRPADYMSGLIKDTGLTLEDFEGLSVPPFFGAVEYPVKPEAEERYEKARETIKQRITDLYHAGRIRYGSW